LILPLVNAGSILHHCTIGYWHDSVVWLFCQGFRMNPSSWPVFLQKILKDAYCAPETCFKKVSRLRLHGFQKLCID